MKMMKMCLFLLMLIFPLLVVAQEKQSVVTLKNGIELKGTIKSIDLTDAVTIVISGIETTIKMSDVAKIEEGKDNVPSNSQLSPNEKLIVTDTAEYPESFELDVYGTKIKMILVKGGEMNMGFDGDDSMDMKSEPVHKVKVTSFYISDEFIPSLLAAKLTDKKINTKWPYHEDKWIEVYDMVNAIAEKVNMPVRLPFEAEWEFAACSKQQDRIFSKCNNNEFCFDYFGEFNKLTESVVDPIGPRQGRRHVVRYYGEKNEKFDRSESDSRNHFRIVIKAKNVRFNMNSITQ